MDGNQLPEVVESTTWARRNKKLDLQPLLQTPMICNRKVNQAKPGKYEIPADVNKTLQGVVDHAHPRDILEPHGLMVLGLLN
ncbi:hypothetical protein PGQ11_007021 [Apiospora arundinis]|uniref:Uncharacterized protein n=1 Tax=Apiospora arundinis TaxID=335852 RepID=A0ABR2IUS3_9PEZI